MIQEKDRSQLLRMAGNIACGLVTGVHGLLDRDKIASISADIAYKTMLKVDEIIANEKQP